VHNLDVHILLLMLVILSAWSFARSDGGKHLNLKKSLTKALCLNPNILFKEIECS
jgi:hypothetical protein